MRTAVASRFDDFGLPVACGGTLGVHQQGVAHKTLPCGTMVTITYNGRTVTVPVVDRGPYIAGREFAEAGAQAKLDAEANQLANHLLEQGFGVGDHIGIYAMNSVQWVEALLAICKARAAGSRARERAGPPR